MATAMDSVFKTFPLNTGEEIPSVGLGTHRIRDREEALQLLDEALSAGCRMFEMGIAYRHESQLKEAFEKLLPKHKLQRDDIYIITKFNAVENVLQPGYMLNAYKASLNNLGLAYANLHLVNFPVSWKKSVDSEKYTDLRHAAWEGMIEVHNNALASAIGVCNLDLSNFGILMKRNHGFVPAVNQVDLLPFLNKMDSFHFCRANDIVVLAYSPLGHEVASKEKLLLHPSITKIAEKLEVTNAQVVQKWALQHGISVMSKSDRIDPADIRGSIALHFDISTEDMIILNKLSMTEIRTEVPLVV